MNDDIRMAKYRQFARFSPGVRLVGMGSRGMTVVRPSTHSCTWTERKLMMSYFWNFDDNGATCQSRHLRCFPSSMQVRMSLGLLSYR